MKQYNYLAFTFSKMLLCHKGLHCKLVELILHLERLPPVNMNVVLYLDLLLPTINIGIMPG